MCIRDSPVTLSVTGSGGGSHHAIGDIVFAWSHYSRMRRFPSNGSRLFGVIRKDVVQCIVDLRNHQSLSSEPTEVSGASLIWQSLVSFWWSSKVNLDNTGHGYRWVFSLLLRLEEPRTQQEIPVHLHAHFAGEVHSWCKSSWISQPNADSCVVIGY